MRTFGLLQIVSRLFLVVITTDTWNLKHFHCPVQYTVYNLKPGGLVTPNGAGMPNIARLTLARKILDNYVARFENSDRQCMRPVLSYSLE